jgi:superfamily II DNA helicase RecQ
MEMKGTSTTLTCSLDAHLTSLKKKNFEEFAKGDGKIKVLVATVAFGMGINIHALKQVVVYDVPKWPTTLMQMIGRCSRGNEKGSCVMLLPVVPTTGSLAFEIKNSCPRKVLLGKLCGPQLSDVMDISKPCSEDCTCQKCTCCSFCRHH